MAKQKKDPSEKLGFGNLLVWNSRQISTSVYVLMAGFLMAYCTDTLGINPALISIIMVASKLLDGVTDAFAGFIVDRTKTKWGKARPYELFIFLMWICTWLMFSCPTGLSEVLKCVWIFIMYSLVNAVAYTFLNANQNVYLVRAFKGNQIVKLTSYSSVITMLASVIFNIAFPILMATYATSARGWSLLVGCFAIAMGAIGILRFIFVKEKYDVDAEKTEESLKISDAVAVIKGNKYILILAFMGLLFNFVTNMGTQVYYYTWIVGNVGLMSIASAVQIIAIPLAFVFPPLLKKISVVKLMFIGFIISGIGIVSLAKKVGAALGSAGLGVMLAAVGYDGNLSVQSDGTLLGIRLLFSVVPMVLYIVVAVSLTGYFKLDKQMPQIKEENEKKRAFAVAQAKQEESEQ